MTVPVWAWITVVGFILAGLAVDLVLLHRRADMVTTGKGALGNALWITLVLGLSSSSPTPCGAWCTCATARCHPRPRGSQDAGGPGVRAAHMGFVRGDRDLADHNFRGVDLALAPDLIVTSASGFVGGAPRNGLLLRARSRH